MQHNELKPFGKIRNFFWPIYSFELKKLIPMFVLFFLITFVYNLLRCLKSSLMINAAGAAGAEVLPFLKTGTVLPGALLLTYIFTKLVTRFTREQVFYTMLTGFLTYFTLFMLVLYPNNELLQLDFIADYLQKNVLFYNGFSGLIAVIRHWNISLFYTLSEMWSVVVLSMLFWGFANEVTKIDEAKRFYAIFALGANSSGIFTGEFAKIVNKLPSINLLGYGIENNSWIFYQLSSVILIGLVIIYLFYWLNHSVFELERAESLTIPKKNNKMSLSECFSYLKKSKYLICIVTIVVAYNVVFNLADVIITNKMAQVYTDKKSLNAYMNNLTQLTGVIAVIFAFIVSGNVIRKYGWLAAALITPIVWFLTSIGFFGGLLVENSSYSDVLYFFTSNPANLILMLGAMEYCLGRGCKYTVFDETKEIAFIPLSREEQRKSKAVVDGLASRLGKSTGSMLLIVLFMFSGGIVQAIPYVTIIIFVIISLWIYAVITLNKMLKKNVDVGIVSEDKAEEVKNKKVAVPNPIPSS